MMLPRVFLLRPKFSSTNIFTCREWPMVPKKNSSISPTIDHPFVGILILWQGSIRIEGKTTAQHRLWTGGQEHERFCRLEPKWPLFNDWKSPCFWLRTFRGWEPTEICITINLQYNKNLWVGFFGKTLGMVGFLTCLRCSVFSVEKGHTHECYDSIASGTVWEYHGHWYE